MTEPFDVDNGVTENTRASPRIAQQEVSPRDARGVRATTGPRSTVDG